MSYENVYQRNSKIYVYFGLTKYKVRESKLISLQLNAHSVIQAVFDPETGRSQGCERDSNKARNRWKSPLEIAMNCDENV